MGRAFKASTAPAMEVTSSHNWILISIAILILSLTSEQVMLELPVPPFRSMTPNPLPPIVFSSSEERSRALKEAGHFGLEEAENLFENLEPQLYTQGVYLTDNEPARYLAAINTLDSEGKLLSRAAYASLQATQQFSDKLFLSKQQIIFSLLQVNVSGTPLALECPTTSRMSECHKETLKYRNVDGSCNNPRHPTWGQSHRPFQRLLPPDYDDGISIVRRSISGRQLPSARSVSSTIHRDENRPNGNVTQILMQWGQFLDHDLTFTPMTRGFNNSALKCCKLKPELMHPECFPIIIPTDDSFYSKYNQTCMEFVRSSPAPTDDCSLGPRNQINQVSSYLDASNVYGSTDRKADKLRAYRHGLLAVHKIGVRLPLLPFAPESPPEECRNAGNLFCFRAGDNRVNEQPGLASMHTLWVREHNRVARELASLNPHWEDEQLFQEARRIVIAEMQRVTYNEFLPLVLGPTVMRLFGLELQENGYYWGYDPRLDATMPNVFGSAVFRFGHSLVPAAMHRCDKFFNPVHPEINLAKEMMRPSILHSYSAVDRLLLGLASQESQQRDEFVTSQLTNHLFQSERKKMSYSLPKSHHYGMDLISINIQRGRDHGLPSYVKWREYCGLRKLTSFKDLEGLVDPKTVRRLEKVYKYVDDIDLFPGGMAEKPVVGGLVGPTFGCLIGQVFQNLRNGDRMWFENGGFLSSFTAAQLKALQKSSLARVLCDNLDDVNTLQISVMKAKMKGSNPRVTCRALRIPALNLSAWKETTIKRRPTFFQKPNVSFFPQWLPQLGLTRKKQKRQLKSS